MKLYKTDGIVIKRKNFGEADRLLTILTPQFGKMKVLAKGIRKITSKRSGHVELFQKTKFGLYEGKTFDIVTEAVRLPGYSFSEQQLISISYAFYICELVDLLLPEYQEHTDVFELVESSFMDLSKHNDSNLCDSIVSQTALELLRLLGYLPKEKQVPNGSLNSYIESITERKLKTLRFIEKIHA